MALTEQQSRFLEAYVRDHKIRGKGKQKRADKFSAMRQQVLDALGRAPSGLPNREDLLKQMAAADLLGEELKFDRATEAMKQVLSNLRDSVLNFKPVVQVHPSQQEPGDPEKQRKLASQLRGIVNDRSPATSWAQLANDPKLGGDLKILANGAGGLLMKRPSPTVGDLANAERMIGELTAKRDLIGRRNAEVDKRIRQLRKYAEELQNDDKSYRNLAEERLAAQALLLADKPGAEWNEDDRTLATSLYLDMMLAIGSRDAVPQKNFKEGQDDQIVLAVRNKDGGNFKMVVKPMNNEVAVAGFKKGSGASREMMGSVVGDKLQEMLGLDLNVPPTKLMKVDSEMIGLPHGEKVTVSVQSFVKSGVTPRAEGRERYIKKFNTDPRMIEIGPLAAEFIEERCGKKEIQEKAVFDLISLHTDRHEDNFMVGDEGNLIPIDHGNILPSKEGLRQRANELGPGHAILAQTATANEKLDEAMMQSIERLNVDELVASMKGAKEKMSIETPDADVGELDEGFDNVRRSAEFLKFAARHLSLKQIYEAYRSCQDEIFFSDEAEKLQGFQNAINIITADGSQLKEANEKYRLNTEAGYNEARAKLRKLEWFECTSPADIKKFVRKYPNRFNEIIENSINAPALVVPKDIPETPHDVDRKSWLYYWALGGDRAVRQYGFSLDESVEGRIGQLSYMMAVKGRVP